MGQGRSDGQAMTLAATSRQAAVGRSDRRAYRSRAYKKTRDEIATVATSSRAAGVLSGIRPQSVCLNPTLRHLAPPCFLATDPPNPMIRFPSSRNISLLEILGRVSRAQKHEFQARCRGHRIWSKDVA